MRVEYVKPIIEKIQDAKNEALLQNKKIEKIWLNKKEWREFCEYIENNTSFIMRTESNDGRWKEERIRTYMTQTEISYDGTTIGSEI